MDRFQLCRAGLLAAGLTVSLGVSAGAQQSPISATAPSGGLTLSQAIREALQQRPLLTADTARAEAARARVGQARAGLRPRVDLQFSASEGLPGAPQVFIGGLAGSPFKKHVGGSVTLTQTLLDFGRTRAAVRASQAEVAASEQALQVDRQQVALEVQQAYFQALQAQRLLQVNEQIREQRKLVARQAETLRENGLASRVDVELAEVQVSQAELSVVSARNDIQTAFAALSAAMGRVVPVRVVLEDTVRGGMGEAASTPVDAEAAVAEALKNRPELQQLEAQVRAEQSRVAAARAGKKPLLNALASVGKVNPGPLIQEADDPYAVAVVLAFPLFTGGLVEGQIEEAKRNTAAARAGRDELANQVRQQVISALANLTASEEMLRVAEAQLKRAQDAQNLATERYRVQLGSIVELGQAQAAFASAQNDLIRARYDRELARAALDFVLGRQAIDPGTPPR